MRRASSRRPRSPARTRPRPSATQPRSARAFSGSNSSTGLPVSAGDHLPGAHEQANSRSSPQGGVASSTVWPSCVSKPAACSAAATHSGRDRSVDRRRGGQRDPQPARIRADLLGERPLGRRRPVRVAGLVPGHHVEERGGVGDGARERAARREALEPAVRRRRDAPARRLDPEQAAARRGDPDRSAAVAALRRRRQRGRDRGRRAAARPARRPRRVPRVAAGAVQLRLGHCGQTRARACSSCPSTTKPASFRRRTTAPSNSGT